MEKEAINETGIDLREVLTVNDLVRSDDCFFAATGISGGDFLRGVRYSARHAVTHFAGFARQNRHTAVCGVLSQYGQTL